MGMMGGFLGGGVETVPAGKHQIYLQWQTEDRQNLSGVSFTINGTQTVQADQYGRAKVLVDAGDPCTVAVSHTGTYQGDGPQTFETPSTEQSFAYFYGALNRALDAYPVGSIYMSMDATNPASKLGGGTWEQIARGRTLIGEGESDQAFAAGSQGGESKHKLTTSEMPNHRHSVQYCSVSSGNSSIEVIDGSSSHQSRVGSAGYEANLTTTYVGGGSSHNNLPPYLVCYIWQRTA